MLEIFSCISFLFEPPWYQQQQKQQNRKNTQKNKPKRPKKRLRNT